MRPERFTASLFSSYDGLLIFGESLISASGDALAADRVSGPERPHPAIPSPRRTAFHPIEPIPRGLANGRCGGNLSHPPDTGVSAAERRFWTFTPSQRKGEVRPIANPPNVDKLPVPQPGGSRREALTRSRLGCSQSASPAASRRPDRYSSRCSAFRRNPASGWITTGVMARSRATTARASSSRPIWA